jgi:hypothetical protein
MLLNSDQSYHRDNSISLVILYHLNKNSLAELLPEQLVDMSNYMSMLLPVSGRNQESLEPENTFVAAKAVIL